IDEVHNLENRVRSSYTQDMFYKKMKKEADAAKQINRSIGEPLDKSLKEYHEYIEQVFNSLQGQISRQDKKAKKEDREIERYSVCPEKIEGLKGICQCLHDINFYASMDFGLNDYARNRDYSREIEALEEQERFFQSLNAEDSEDIFWMTVKGKGHNGICLSSCPKEVDKLTNKLLFQSMRFSTILTSATITSGNSEKYLQNYRYFIRNINFPYKAGVISEPKQSPFDYDKHAMIYYTEGMPHPSRQRKRFIAAGVAEIIRLITLTEGKTLILFTAKADMKEVYQLLKGRIPYKILMQKDGDSQKEILDQFKSNVNSVLLGTGSYWEGISVEGMTLSSVIIFKLPFPVPEPIIDYKCGMSGDKSLMEVLVPEMVIKLKQGIGRLIRNQSDRGIVTIIDSRVGEQSKAPYKQLIWDSLPIKNRTNDFSKIDEFYNSIVLEK
ncbi:MAG: ATP-dependent DNA helicase, partial [Lachnospiraceae bacterium]|nr:ATP-dependent DNA helicase [Lachnospiraceae bacterium]